MNCTLYCAAYLLGEKADILIKEIGHDGTAVQWPEYIDCRRTRGISLPEIQNCFFKRKLMLAPIFLSPMVAPGEDAKPLHIWSATDCAKRYYAMTANRRSIIMGQLTNGIGHAIVLDHDKYVDPRLGVATFPAPDDFHPQEAYLVTRI